MTGYCIVHAGNTGLFIPACDAGRLAHALRREITGPGQGYLPPGHTIDDGSAARGEIASLIHKLDAAAQLASEHAARAVRLGPSADAGGERQ